MKRYITVNVQYDLGCKELKFQDITPVNDVKKIVENDMKDYFGWDEGYEGLTVSVEDK